MITALSVIAVFGIIVFLSGVAFGVFILFVISLRRTPRVPLSQVQDERAGSLSRRVLTGSRPGSREISQ
jgi:hypothetical protein